MMESIRLLAGKPLISWVTFLTHLLLIVRGEGECKAIINIL